MSAWQPIETCPLKPFSHATWYERASERVLLCDVSKYGGRVYIGEYGFTERGKGRWLDYHGRVAHPTHWMPLPEPPK